jgi:hypothetical protein
MRTCLKDRADDAVPVASHCLEVPSPLSTHCHTANVIIA